MNLDSIVGHTCLPLESRSRFPTSHSDEALAWQCRVCALKRYAAANLGCEEEYVVHPDACCIKKCVTDQVGSGSFAVSHRIKVFKFAFDKSNSIQSQFTGS